MTVPAAGKPKKAKGGKKRKQQQSSQAEQQKKPKLEDEEEGGLSDKDKLTLNRWKGLQLDTRPFIHPIRKMVRTGEPDASYVQQQDLLIRQQFGEIENQQKQILEYERMIKEQNILIAALRDKHTALVLECQESGVKLPQELLDNSVIKSTSSSSCQMLPPSHSNPGMPVQTRLSSLPPPHPPTSSSSSLPPASPASVFSPAPPMIQPAYPNISPTNRTPPPHIPPPLIRPPPPPHHTSVSLEHLSNSSCVVDSVHGSNSSTYPLHPRHQRIPIHQGHAQFIALDQSQRLMGGGGHTGHAQNQSHLPSTSGALRLQSFPTTRKNMHTSPPMLIDDITFSPLTSGELKGLEQANSYQPPPALISYNEDLDSILNLSMLSGGGAGYGVGVKEEDLLQGSLQIDLRYVHTIRTVQLSELQVFVLLCLLK